jgi:hypothetical protein
MCTFITAIVPKDADTTELTAIFRAHGRACRAYVNPALAAQIDAAQAAYYTTVGHCDCGTPLGEMHKAVGRAKDPEAIADRYRRKGWSEAKIARAIMQQDEADARPRDPLRGEQRQTSLSEWCALIREALTLPGLPSVGLLMHDYHDSVDDEAIVLQGRELLYAGDLNEAMLASMHPTRIYEFRR